MEIRISNIDTLFFKDGRPFSMGEETWANDLFPPNPSVFAGAIRTAYLSNQKIPAKDFNTEKDPTINLKIKAILYEIKKEIYLPVPSDLIFENLNGNSRRLTALKLASAENLISNYKLPFYLQYEGKENVTKDDKLLLSLQSFQNYLNGKYDNLEFKNLGDFIKDEPKVGIGRDNLTKSTSEGKLYRINMKRLDGLNFIVDFENINLNEKGFLKFGGENKVVKYEESQHDIKNLFNNMNKPQNKLVKLYLLTPAIFKNGSFPDTDSELFRKYKMKLIAAAVDGYNSTGGFDMKSVEPKMMYRAVREGSVYFFEFDGDFEQLRKDFNFNSISDFEKSIGYGITIVGLVQ